MVEGEKGGERGYERDSIRGRKVGSMVGNERKEIKQKGKGRRKEELTKRTWEERACLEREKKKSGAEREGEGKRVYKVGE